MPDAPIIDSHVHFWDRANVPVSWTAGSPLDRDFSPADHRAAVGDAEIEALVFVEADVDAAYHLAEADMVTRLAKDDPRIAAIVAHAPMASPDVKHDLATLARRPLVRGVRDLIQKHDAQAMCDDPAFREGLRRLPEHALHFELCLLHHQFAPVLRLVEALPEVTFVLDHIAKPGIRDGVRAPWWGDMASLAAFPNVTCKLSGVATEADHGAWEPAQLVPYMARALEVFGPDRMMFGSDWPVMTLAITYTRWLALVDEVLAPLTLQERRSVYAETARRVYRLSSAVR